MIDRSKFTKAAGQTARDLSLVAVGALAIIHYLQWRGLISREALRDLTNLLFFGFMLLALLGNMLGEPPEKRSFKEPSPRIIGVTVVTATGFAAAMALWWDGQTMAAPVPLFVAWIASMFVWSFASRHADDIGEARFRGE